MLLLVAVEEVLGSHPFLQLEEQPKLYQVEEEVLGLFQLQLLEEAEELQMKVVLQTQIQKSL